MVKRWRKGRDDSRPAPGRPRKAKAKEPSSEPDVFQEMLAEAGAASRASASEDGRAIKKRRVGGRLVVSGGHDGLQDPRPEDAAAAKQGEATDQEPTLYEPARVRQTIYNDDDDDDDDDSEDNDDADWEDVTLGALGGEAQSKPTRDVGDLNLDFGADDLRLDKASGPRRKHLTAAERKLRLEVHKMHVLALVAHVHRRNHWCNDLEVQACLRKLLPASVVKCLEDNEVQSQFQRSGSLTDGLEKAAEVFRQHFEISARGMTRNYWAEDQEQLDELPIPEDIDLPVRKEDFRDLAEKKSASRDIGAQLFCAMLRSFSLDVRLVCSLQPLPFVSVAKSQTPMKPQPARTVAYPETREGMIGNDSGHESHDERSDHASSPDVKAYSSPGAVPKPVRRFGRAGFSSKPPPKPKVAATLPRPRNKRIRESPYPIFWVEVFNPALQKWIPVDPLVTKTISKPSKFEPPASDPENNLSYVLAFEEDGYAKDVTRRYAKAYNAKTRRSRVDGTKGGDKWWKRVLRMYQPSYQLDRDQVENAELATKEAQEPMPRNIQEFKNHHYYALERHLRRNEVLHPKRQVGKVSTGTNKPLEPIYRRNDVHVVKSAESWFRLGRELKPDEKPLKTLEPKRRKTGRNSHAYDDIEGDPFADDAPTNERPGQPMYAAFQTSLYVPPPISNGRVPRNVYGNIDIYTPSMIPAGAVWISHPFAAGAAKLLGVDHANAVTGFEFKGRQGTAVVKGIVVAGEFHEGVVEAIEGFQWAFEEEEGIRRSDMAMRGWRRFLRGLRIRERIVGLGGGDDAGEKKGTKGEDESSGSDGGGGFLPDRHATSSTSNMPAPEPDLEPIEDLDEAAPISKALLDAREPIGVTWGKPLPPEPEPKRQRAGDAPEPVQGGEVEGLVLEDEPSNDYGDGGFLPEVEPSMGPDGGHNGRANGDVSWDISGRFVPQPEGSDEQGRPPNLSSQGQGDEMALEEGGDGVGGGNGSVADRHDHRDASGNAASSTAVEQQATTPVPLKSSKAELGATSDIHIGKNNSSKDDAGEVGQVGKAAKDEIREGEEVGKGEEEEGKKDETGSLLSHDPEDEDADPEWLV